MRVAIVYYSKTGRTRRVAEYIRDKLVNEGFEVQIFEVKPVHDYSSFMLHLNPRVIYETIKGKIIEIIGVEKFSPDEFDFIFIGSPIWFGTITPPIRSFINMFKDKISDKPVICFTTSAIHRNYSLKFKEILDSMKFNVILHFEITNLDKERDIIDNVINEIKSKAGM